MSSKVQVGTWNGVDYSVDGIAHSFKNVMARYGFRWVRGVGGKGTYFGDRAAAESFVADMADVGLTIRDMREAGQ